MKPTAFIPAKALSPNALIGTISELVKAGYSQKQAIYMAYAEMKNAWRQKHPKVKLPVWLMVESRGKNPAKRGAVKTAQISKMVGSGWLLEISKDGKILSEKVYPNYYYARDAATKLGLQTPRFPARRGKNPMKKYGARSISPDTTEISVSGKKHTIYDAYPSMAMATKYAKDYIKNGQGNAVVRDLSAKAGRLRYALFVTDSFTQRFYSGAGKNPVRPLKSKKKLVLTDGLYEIRYQKNSAGKVYYYTGKQSFDSNKKNRALYTSELAAKNVWRSISGLHPIGNNARVVIAK